MTKRSNAELAVEFLAHLEGNGRKPRVEVRPRVSNSISNEFIVLGSDTTDTSYLGFQRLIDGWLTKQGEHKSEKQIDNILDEVIRRMPRKTVPDKQG